MADLTYFEQRDYDEANAFLSPLVKCIISDVLPETYKKNNGLLENVRFDISPFTAVFYFITRSGNIVSEEHGSKLLPVLELYNIFLQSLIKSCNYGFLNEEQTSRVSLKQADFLLLSDGLCSNIIRNEFSLISSISFIRDKDRKRARNIRLCLIKRLLDLSKTNHARIQADLMMIKLIYYISIFKEIKPNNTELFLSYYTNENMDINFERDMKYINKVFNYLRLSSII